MVKSLGSDYDSPKHISFIIILCKGLEGHLAHLVSKMHTPGLLIQCIIEHHIVVFMQELSYSEKFENLH